jgi:hypothetical protein
VREPGKDDKTEPPEGWDKPDEKGRLPGIDEGWNYAPGESRAEELRKIVAEKAAKLPEELAAAFVKEAKSVLPVPVPPAPRTVDEFIAAGKKITGGLPSNPRKLHPALMNRLKTEVGTGKSAKVARPFDGDNRGATLVRAASRAYPAAWVKAGDDFGPLHAKYITTRAWSLSLKRDPVGRLVKLDDFGVVRVQKNAGYIAVSSNIDAIHEYAHRLQDALPELQARFEELHLRRAAGEKSRQLVGFARGEMGRKDHYIDAYWGREYDGEPLEVMSMAFETVLSGYKTKESGDFFENLYNKDREMFDFTVGLLFHWKLKP